ncbi:MAG: helix-turn-helix transcriptional regulator [Armatimonadota bacterium]|nr:helix-turn-helix transcriptional regulator [Armatimonadota bacterium]MDR7440159.1 helix-turn-helix transcriptional regulator [Armatimonadota bacterium]MDR7562617.1 helix-turn-helix transcriptional regulator [Armatimonadota bacterium]MDR7567978.1 helix-turn-helix transcriptional regulator [Armatimonadota bacterium]MDR7602912.1 helix-turn-helix transcriptional regulator [Armatimonadota bacterium]
MMIEGLTDAQMARRLNLATPTVKAQLRRLYRRLGVHNRAQAVVLGLLG